MIKVVIIEDEDQIRKTLATLVTTLHDDCVIVGQAGSVISGIETIKATQPDLLLMDIKLTDGNSFEILDKVNIDNTKIIFITAFNEFAIKAFKYSAVDYLLKPVDPDELETTLQRVNDQIDATQLKMELLKENLVAKQPSKLLLNTREGLHVVPIEDIIYCESQSGYTCFYLNDKRKILVSKTIKEFDKMLNDNPYFFRVHQSYLVNLNFVQQVNKEGTLALSSGESIPVSTRKKEAFMEALKAH